MGNKRQRPEHGTDGVNATSGDGSYGEESNGKHGAFAVVLTVRSCGRLMDAGVDERQRIEGDRRRAEEEDDDALVDGDPNSTWSA